MQNTLKAKRTKIQAENHFQSRKDTKNNWNCEQLLSNAGHLTDVDPG